jgi:hypothetical protein
MGAMYLASPYYRIISPDGEHVATVKAEDVADNLDLYNRTRREIDIDGRPVGEYQAEAYDGYVAGSR